MQAAPVVSDDQPPGSLTGRFKGFFWAARSQIGWAAGAVVLWVVLNHVLSKGLPLGIVLLGVIYGAIYALLAMGIVLVYRGNRIINFAQAQIGVIAAILAIALYSDQANRAGVLGLSDDLLNELDGRIAQQISAYVDPVGRAMTIFNDTLHGADDNSRAALFVRVAASALRSLPQVTQFLWADPAGDFLEVRRGEGGTIEYKRILNGPGNRLVEWIRLDTDGQEIGRTPDPTDVYDPRQRPWFTGAMKSDGIAWTGVYFFSIDQAPGVTASRMYAGPGGRVDVFGADIKLEALSRFLSSLKIGSNGRALIIDSAGTLVALPDVKRMLRREGDSLTVARLDQLDDPVLVAAFDRYRVEGFGRRVITADGKRYISIVSHLPATGTDWAVMIVVPEDDFTGFVQANRRVALIVSLIVVALAALLAGLLAAQGLRADRTALQLLERSRAIERQSAAYRSLAAEFGSFDPKAPDAGEATGRAAEILADACDARRAGIWRLDAGGAVLHCVDSYERESGGHTAGLEFSRVEMPEFFAHLVNGEELLVADAVMDPRTSGLHRTMMHALGSKALLVVPVRGPAGIAGAVLLEDAAENTQDFARTVANMLALRLAAGGPEPVAGRAAQRSPEPEAAPFVEWRQDVMTTPVRRSFDAELATRGLDPDRLAAEVFPDVAVLVLRLGDSVALAASTARGGAALADGIACALQDIAQAHDISYLKILGQDAVAAAGLGARDPGAIERIAGMAMALRERLNELYDEARQVPDFRIGLDLGIAIGSPLGHGPRLYNLWGEAVQVAATMADSAPAGAVQVTEAAYNHLARSFLFRSRGNFWLPRVGESRMFVLAGHV